MNMTPEILEIVHIAIKSERNAADVRDYDRFRDLTGATVDQFRLALQYEARFHFKVGADGEPYDITEVPYTYDPGTQSFSGTEALFGVRRADDPEFPNQMFVLASCEEEDGPNIRSAAEKAYAIVLERRRSEA